MVAIANQALGWLKANRISSIDDDSVEADLIRENWDHVRRAVLGEREWTFAVKRRALTPNAQDPAFGTRKAFTLPSDCLQVLTVRSDGLEDDRPNTLQWEIEGNQVLAQADRVYVRYIGDVKDPVRFPPLFRAAVAARLAWDLAMPLTRSNTVQKSAQQRYASMVGVAGVRDSQQGRTRKLRGPRYRSRESSFMGPTV